MIMYKTELQFIDITSNRMTKQRQIYLYGY